MLPVELGVEVAFEVDATVDVGTELDARDEPLEVRVNAPSPTAAADAIPTEPSRSLFRTINFSFK